MICMCRCGGGSIQVPNTSATNFLQSGVYARAVKCVANKKASLAAGCLRNYRKCVL